MINVKSLSLLLLVHLSLLFVLPTVHADDDSKPTRTSLKVCADPNYQPFSTRDLQGYENKIAELIGQSLKLSVEYYWFPQRLGFVRNTLRKENPEGEGYLCDLVMGVPQQFELAVTSKPYLQSTYALVINEKGRLGGLKNATDLLSIDDSKKAAMKIGVTERSQGAVWLAKHNLYQQISPYIAQSGDPEEFPGQPILQDLLAGKLDAAIVWGPIAGYFTQADKNAALTLLPLKSEPDVRFNFAISAAVRFGEDAFENQINQALSENNAKIQEILKEYNIPLVNDAGEIL